MSEAVQKFQRYTVEWLYIRDLSPHPQVQRSLDKAWMGSIRDGFDPDKFRELYVVKAPGGKWWIFDGQHRHGAALEALGHDQKAPCRVWDAIPLERQAELFLDINKSKAVSALDKWRVRLLAKEEVPLKIEALLHRHKLHVSATRAEGVVQAVAALESIWTRQGGEAVLGSVLSILAAAWGRAPEAYDGLILRGLAGVVHRFGDVIVEKELAAKLARKGTPGGMVGKAKNTAQVMAKGAIRTMTELIVNIYNEKRRTSRLEL